MEERKVKTVEIAPELHHRAKVAALVQRLTLRQFVEAALEAHLEKNGIEVRVRTSEVPSQ